MKKISAIALGLASSLVATAALAQDPAATTTASSGSSSEVKSGVSVAALVGMGFGSGDVNAYKLGIGGRVGYNIENIYVGGTLVYHLGDKKTQTVPFLGELEQKLSMMYYGVEGGYELAAGPVALRPFLGLGQASFKAEVMGVSASTSKMAFWPGVTVMYPLGSAFVGADARYVIVMGGDEVKDANALAAYLTVGAKF
jgi:hypothetical protein